MKIKCICILLFSMLSISNCVLAQYPKTMYNYNGNGSDVGIYFWYDIVLTYSVPITGHYSMTSATGADKGIFCNNIKSNAIINNTLSNVNRVIAPPSNRVSCSAYDTAIGDYYQNNLFLTVVSGYNQNTVKLPIQYDNMSTSVNFANAVYSSLFSFPVNKLLLPAATLKYLDATAEVESNNASIKSTAQTITSGCTDYRTAVIKLCQWIEANIKMQDNAPQTKSSQVLSNKLAKCDGAAHLLAAFCRSLNIPARIVNGYIVQHGVTYPTNTGSITLGSGNGTTLVGHAACEIYVPYMNNWVRCDPAQRTVLFGPQQFIKVATGMDAKDISYYGWSAFSYTFNQPTAPSLTKMDLNPSVFYSYPISNYKLVNSETFQGTANTSGNFGLLCAVPPQVATGFEDMTTIQGQPYPNPVNDLLSFPCNGEPIRVEIYDLKGTRLYTEMLSGEDTCQLDVSFLNTGLYLVRVDGETYKIAKN